MRRALAAPSEESVQLFLFTFGLGVNRSIVFIADEPGETETRRLLARRDAVTDALDPSDDADGISLQHPMKIARTRARSKFLAFPAWKIKKVRSGHPSRPQ